MHSHVSPSRRDERTGLLRRKTLFVGFALLALAPMLALIIGGEPIAKPQSEENQTMSDSNSYKDKLTDAQYNVCFEKGTEPPFSGKYYKTTTPGTYHCVACGQSLFSSDHKYDSGSGWPSFWKPSDETNLAFHEDRSLGMVRTEVTCSNCGAHLGHVFEDGPEPTGKRYCINSLALELVPKDGATQR